MNDASPAVPQGNESSDVEPIVGTLGLARGFLRVRSDPEPFLAGLAHRAVDGLPFPLDGSRLLDLGCGTGHLAREIERRGHTVFATDLDMDDLEVGQPPHAFNADATRLGVRGESIDGVICSNVLEHTPSPELVFAEIERILVPGGWAWVSWTPWWTPFGGHAIAPFHLLGRERGSRWYERTLGEPSGKNLPNDGVWETTVAQVLGIVDDIDGLELRAAVPRYYPRLRWIMKLNHAREFLVWNCALTVTKSVRG